MTRKKKMMFATLMAATAITMFLMTRALAAPAGVYQSQNSLNQYAGSRYGWHNPPPAPTATTAPAPAATPIPTAWPTPTATATPLPTAKPTPTATATPIPTAKPAPTASAAPVKPVSGNMSADESRMINLVNQDRANNGLKPLTFDSGLRAGALSHSQDMAQNNYFSHTSPTQGDFGARIKASGVKHTSAGENIAEYGSVDQAEAGFMNSPGHRANILGDFTRVGIGIVNKGGTYIITQWFAK